MYDKTRKILIDSVKKNWYIFLEFESSALDCFTSIQPQRGEREHINTSLFHFILLVHTTSQNVLIVHNLQRQVSMRIDLVMLRCENDDLAAVAWLLY